MSLMRRLRRALAPVAFIALVAWMVPFLPRDTPRALLVVPMAAAGALAVLLFSGIRIGGWPSEGEDDEDRH